MKNKSLKNLMLAFGMLAAGTSGAVAQSFTEGFDNLANLTDWFVDNNSDSPGNNWGGGNPANFTAQAGATNSYVAAAWSSTSSTATNATISNWLFTPSRVFNNGDVITFWTRKPTASFPDRLQVRMNTNGPGMNVGTTATDLGDYTTLLLDINPTLTAAGYPITWTQYTITISGLSGPTSGRIAFRYFVTSGGTNGANSDYIGIDTYSYTSSLAAPANDNCAGAVTLTQGASCTPVPGTIAGATASTPATTCDGTANDDVWYKFVATSANAHINFVGSTGFDGVLQVYQGASCGAMTSITCQDTSLMNGVESMRFGDLTVGQTYYIRVFDWYGTWPSTLGFTICVESFAGCSLTQPAGSVAETETCGGSTNDGCNATPTPVYQDISCGDVIWGTAGTTGTTRDTDWYRFTLTNPTTVTWTVNTEFPALLAFVDISNCAAPNPIIASTTTNGCGATVLSYTFPAAGTYVALVAPNSFFGYSCGSSNDYSAALSMATTTPVVTATGPTTVCGGPVSLNTTGTGTFVWYNGATPIGGATTASYSATGSGNYSTMVTDANGCHSTSAPLMITVNPVDNASFSYAASNACEGSSTTIAATPTTSGGTYSATPAGLSVGASTGLITAASSSDGVYTVTYNTNGTCPASSTQTVTINPSTDATFSYTTYTICSGSANPVATTTNAGGVFSSGSGLSFANTATGEIDIPGSTDGTYTVTYTTTNGSCVLSTSHDVTITAAPDASFSYSANNYCSNTADPSPSFDPGASAGVFSSATGLVIDANGTIDVSASTPGTYTVTNNIAASGACPAASSTESVEIEAAVSPSFTQLGNVCQGASSPVFPSTSMNGVAGTWSPVFNNMATTTYTFTPDAGECANPATMTVTVDVPLTPSFAPTVNTYCEGSTIPAFPTTSINGVNGVWSPAISNTATTTYTFTPNSGQCATTQSQVITINDQVAPTFNAIDALCAGEAAPSLPTASSNGFDGTWSPATISTATAGTTTYTFTPAADECASTGTLQVVVESCLGVAENVAENLTVYPNPAGNEVMISFTNATGGNVDLIMISGDGKTVYTSAASSQGDFTETVDLSGMAPGVYYIRLTSGNGVSITKLVKN